MIKYLGSKRQLIQHILECIRQHHPSARSAIDLFSGTARVGYALKSTGMQVFANDYNTYAHTLAQCYVASDKETLEQRAQKLLDELSRLPPRPGFFTENFCEKSHFFHPKNGERVDAIREAIEGMDLETDLRAVMLVALMEAADRVDSTCGIQMAYLKQWAKRAHNDLELRMPKLLPRSPNGKGGAVCMDALAAAEVLEADVAYLDPPYNQHSYLGNYHIWETLVRWDKPELYGKAQKRQECREKKSPFNQKRAFLGYFANVIDALRAEVVVISFNNEGFVSQSEMETLLAQRGRVSTRAIDYKRYVGAQIGIYNPKGDKVGQVSHLRNKEFLYVLDRR